MKNTKLAVAVIALLVIIFGQGVVNAQDEPNQRVNIEAEAWEVFDAKGGLQGLVEAGYIEADLDQEIGVEFASSSPLGLVPSENTVIVKSDSGISYGFTLQYLTAEYTADFGDI